MADYEGQFIWYELMTPDIEAAKRFYTDVVGWGTEEWKGGNHDYTILTAAQKPVGGVMVLPEEAKKHGAPPHWMGYVGTTDVRATLNKAQSLGAQVLVPPTPIPEVGAFGVLLDPQGADLAVFTPSGEGPGAGEQTQEGRVSWHELLTTDLNAAWDFYHALFGWEKTEAMDMGSMGIYQMYGKGGRTLGGMMIRPKEMMPGRAMWLYYVKVRDIDDALNHVKSDHGKILNGPMDVPGGGRIAQCMDTQGAMFALHATPHH
jgi:predicted enzyme related to lactoylglutathione lyase